MFSKANAFSHSLAGMANSSSSPIPPFSPSTFDPFNPSPPQPHEKTSINQSILCRSTKRELEIDPLPRQTPIDLGISIETIIDASPLLLVQDDFQDLTAVLAGLDAFPDDLDGVDDVGQDGVVHGRQRARVRPFLRLRGARPVAAFRAGQDAARGQEEDVSV